MKLFTSLFLALDRTTRTTDKLAALVEYFRDEPEADAAWTLYLLSGRRLSRVVNSAELRAWAAEETGLPAWLIEDCYEAVGDLSETISLVLPDRAPADATAAEAPALHTIIEERIAPLRTAPLDARRTLVTRTWRALDATQRLIYHKLISGSFRFGVQRRLLVRALAQLTGASEATLEHRLTGVLNPTVADLRRVLAPASSDDDPARPYPFFLAFPLDEPLETQGDISAWQAEWKWDGLRAQLIRRDGPPLIWSRGEELLNDAFPELVELAAALPRGTVLDGEILAFEQGLPLPFTDLQRRINRKQRDIPLFDDVPVVFMAYDLLELDSQDRRALPLRDRRALLERLINDHPDLPRLRLSPALTAPDWPALDALAARAREQRTEGLMLKRLDAPYGVGRSRGSWWKRKTDPFHADAVLVAAQPGHGRRASLFTDYTFALWDGPSRHRLVPVAKAYSGLTDDEIRETDAFIRAHTTGRHGPVRAVEPLLVFEIAFQAVQKSSRHRSGLALRFPRIARRRPDKRPADADTLDALRALLHAPHP
ncbi:MAG: ATP-dependent DNA ligase, partial [Phycisphaerales bacterium]|nr:ATP-dependent DNA ligase [Phycisphaerales bacterium]